MGGLYNTMVTKITPQNVLEEALGIPSWDAVDIPLRSVAKYIDSGVIKIEEVYDIVRKRRELALDTNTLFDSSPLRYVLGAKVSDISRDRTFDSFERGELETLEHKIVTEEVEDVHSEFYKLRDLPELLSSDEQVESGFLIFKGNQIIGEGRARVKLVPNEDASGFYGYRPLEQTSILLYGKYHSMRKTTSRNVGKFLYKDYQTVFGEFEYKGWEIDSMVRKVILSTRNIDSYKNIDKIAVDNQMAYEILNLGKRDYILYDKIPECIWKHLESNGLECRAVRLLRKQRRKNRLKDWFVTVTMPFRDLGI